MERESVKLPQPLIEGRFYRREGRFKAYAYFNGELESLHVHDPGRLKELLVEGARVLARPHATPRRRTQLYLVAVWSDGCWVLVDSAIHVKLAEEAIKQGRIEELRGVDVVGREPRRGRGRLDLLLERPNGVKVLVEVKGCTLTVDGVALFPDAPTVRGRRHLGELIEAAKEGFECYVLFLVAHCRAREFRPNFEVDEGFARLLLKAAEEGVKPIAYKLRFEGGEVLVDGRLPVILSPLRRPP